MKGFVVIREGVRRNAVFGARETQEDAVALAKESLRREPDSYHDMAVVPLDPPEEGAILVRWSRDFAKRIDALRVPRWGGQSEELRALMATATDDDFEVGR